MSPRSPARGQNRCTSQKPALAAILILPGESQGRKLAACRFNGRFRTRNASSWQLLKARCVQLLGALDVAGARPSAKLVFLERLVTTFSEESVGALANLVRQREQESEVGPIAIITQEDASFEQARQFAYVAGLVRPIRVFLEWHEGRRWIDAVAIDRAKAAE